MTEKEKMLRGVLYNPADDELSRQRDFASKMSKIFNSTDKSQKKGKI